mmetsp:Transcript_3942/g.8885  ORF Transcript_3942/g.8885 Transcript_3942/m.8885 type:complete len:119 (-) Transcript_3942:1411-1767(-)
MDLVCWEACVRARPTLLRIAALLFILACMHTRTFGVFECRGWMDGWMDGCTVCFEERFGFASSGNSAGSRNLARCVPESEYLPGCLCGTPVFRQMEGCVSAYIFVVGFAVPCGNSKLE